MMLARTAGTPGGRRPRTRRSARASAAAAAAAPSSPPALLEPAGPSVPASEVDGGPVAGAANSPDDSAGRQGGVKRPRTGLFTAGSLDDDSLSGAVAAVVDVDTTDDPPVTDIQAPAEDSASGGAQANDRCGTPPPSSTDLVTGDPAPATSAAGPAEPQTEDKPDCGICLETCLHPVKLPCGHVFCFLCVKGAAKQSARCAYCRAKVPQKFINNPRLLDDAEVERELADTSHGHHWLYQGRQGWWRYDERTSRDIEAAFSANEASIQIAVAGELYTVDFGSLTQFNDACHGKRRRVRREAADATPDPTLTCKGVAGLRKKRRRQ